MSGRTIAIYISNLKLRLLSTFSSLIGDAGLSLRMTRFITKELSYLIFLYSLSIVVFLGGCSSWPFWRSNERPDDFIHQVNYPGETLGRIAAWYTGSVDNWKVIQANNPGLDVHRIKIGQFIRIPRSMVVKFTQMPRPKPVGTVGIFQGRDGKDIKDIPFGEGEPPAPSETLKPYYDLGEAGRTDTTVVQPEAKATPITKTPEIVPDIGLEDEDSKKSEEEYSNEILEELLKKPAE